MSKAPIVVGVDGSKPSLRAAVMAWHIAEKTGRRCHVIHAASERPAAAFVPDAWRGARPSTFRFADPRERGALVRALREVVPRAVADTVETRTGRAPQVIAAAAQRLRAELVVVGATRHPRARTAQYLVRHSAWSVLMVRSAPPIRSILVAVDGSPVSQNALRAGQEYAELFDAGLRVAHVIDVPDDRAAGALGRLGRSQAALTQFLERHGRIPGSVRRATTASAGIVSAAKKWRADLVVIAARRLGQVDRLLLGSTTEHLLADLQTSLLVVRIPRAAGLRPRT